MNERRNGNINKEREEVRLLYGKEERKLKIIEGREGRKRHYYGMNGGRKEGRTEVKESENKERRKGI